MNNVVAEHNGIDVSTLINSPNYDKLLDDYYDYAYHLFLDKLKASFSDKESWAILLAALGKI